MEKYYVLGVNPGSTSTKITIYENDTCIFKETIKHSAEELKQFEDIIDQKDFRKQLIIDFIREKGFEVKKLSAVVGRGGFLPEPLTSGTYIVDDNLCDALMHRAVGNHAANLGGLIAKAIADELGLNAYVVDPVSVNETEPLGRISGLGGVERRTLFHCLNVKAVARKVAAQLGDVYENLNMVIVHMGGGISVSAHRKGRTIDSTCGLLGEGAFSPERAGTLEQRELLDIVYNSGKKRKEIEKMLCGQGGMYSYIGTTDCIEAEKMIADGDEKARLVYEAMAYQVSKDIAAQASVLCGKVDAVVITGGMAYSQILTEWIKERVSFIAPVHILPGEFEQEAMTLGTLRVLNGEETAKQFIG